MKKFKWKFEVEIEASEVWVADGFNPTAEQIQSLLDENILGYASDDEKKIKVKLVKAADQKAVAKAQGFKTLAAMKKADRET